MIKKLIKFLFWPIWKMALLDASKIMQDMSFYWCDKLANENRKTLSEHYSNTAAELRCLALKMDIRK